MITEITNSIKAVLYQRISSPIYGAYIASWFICNWQLTFPLLFGNEKFDVRFEVFKAALICEDLTFDWSTLFFPFVITMLLLGLQPIAQRYVYIYTEWNKSEGLKKRDQYSSETMLTIEQSNELRESVKNIQQFNQDIIKNKELEIDQYKNQSKNQSKTIDQLNKSIIDLDGTLAQCESSRSDNSKEIAEKASKISELDNKYTRLSRILSKQRQRTLRNKEKHSALFISKDLLKLLPLFIGVNDSGKLQKKDIQAAKDVLSLSATTEWIEMCHKAMINRFSKCSSFDMADNYFDDLVKPYLKDMSVDNLEDLYETMQTNSQISDRRRGESDLETVGSVLKSKRTLKF